MSNIEEKQKLNSCLDFFLFEGDYGEPGDSELTDKIVKSRCEYICYVCEGKIRVGELHRYSVWKFDRLTTFRCCNKCCQAMVRSIEDDFDDDDDPINKRFEIGDERRNQLIIGDD